MCYRPETADRVVDATGHIVIPGGIDPHVHLHHVWIKPDGTPLVTVGPEQVGRAALHGRYNDIYLFRLLASVAGIQLPLTPERVWNAMQSAKNVGPL